MTDQQISPSSTQPEGAVHQTAMPNESQDSPSLERAPVGPIIAAIVVVAVLAIGGLYYWGNQANEVAQEEVGTLPEQPQESAPSPEALQQVSDQTDLDTIESELQFDVQQLDAELQNLDAELQF